MNQEKLKIFLDGKVDLYNQPSFIKDDPISIPHRYSRKQDIEIAGFFAAIFAWGNRTTIINKTTSLLALMDNAPWQFITQHTDKALEPFLQFKHRTFNSTDLLCFIAFFKYHYTRHQSLESAFTLGLKPGDLTVENGLIGFYQYFISDPDFPERTKKHLASPSKNSSCKRLNMYLRWMVRSDERGVDFGLWKNISPGQLVCPLDVHVARSARRYKLLTRPTPDWKAAMELTDQLRILDRSDPVKYDFALFGMGVMENFNPRI